MVAPSQPAYPSHLGAFPASAGPLPAFPPTDHRVHLGTVIHESQQRKRRMVEISLSGSGERLGRIIAWAYSTPPLLRAVLLGQAGWVQRLQTVC
jgi:hypothetical protein